MSSPCGGCPPCCKSCVFDPEPAGRPAAVQTVVSKQNYGCVRADGGAVVLNAGMLGMMRGEAFHPVTAAGAAFLHTSGNPLSAHY